MIDYEECVTYEARVLIFVESKVEKGMEPCTWVRPKLPHPSILAFSYAKVKPQLLPWIPPSSTSSFSCSLLFLQF